VENMGYRCSRWMGNRYLGLLQHQKLALETLQNSDHRSQGSELDLWKKTGYLHSLLCLGLKSMDCWTPGPMVLQSRSRSWGTAVEKQQVTDWSKRRLGVTLTGNQD
jgi:hypothetical protein